MNHTVDVQWFKDKAHELGDDTIDNPNEWTYAFIEQCLMIGYTKGIVDELQAQLLPTDPLISKVLESMGKMRDFKDQDAHKLELTRVYD